MAELFLQISVSLDGYIEDRNGGGTPLVAADGERRRLTLLGNEQWDSGATLRRYRFA